MQVHLLKPFHKKTPTERMSLKSKIEAVIYASEEPVTLQQLVGLLADEAQAELEEIAASQASLPLDVFDAAGGDASPERSLLEAGMHESVQPGESSERAVSQGEIVSAQRDGAAAESAAVPDAESAFDVQASATDELKLSEEGASTVDATTGEPALTPELTAEDEKRRTRERERAVRDHVRRAVDDLIREYAQGDRGIEIREVASGFRMGTKPEYHDAVRGFVTSLKPALKLTLPALEDAGRRGIQAARNGG